MAPYGVYGDAALDLTDAMAQASTDPEQLDLRGPAHAAPRPIEWMDVFNRGGNGIYDPAMEPAPPAPQQGRGGSFLDAFAENIANGRIMSPRGKQNDAQTLLTALLGSTAQGFARTRLDRRDQAREGQDVMERAAAARNERNLRASEEARASRIGFLKESSRAQRDKRQREEGWVQVPAHVARALGDEGLTGSRVSPETYRGYLEIWRKVQDAGKGKIVLQGPSAKALGVPDGTPVTVGELADLRRAAAAGTRRSDDGEKPLSRREQLTLLNRYDTAEARIRSMNRRLAELRGGNTKDYKVAAKIAELEGALADREAERDAASDALRRAGLSPDDGKPAGGDTEVVSPPANPPIVEPELRTNLRTTRTGAALALGNAASGAGARSVGSSAPASATGRARPKVVLPGSNARNMADVTANTAPAVPLAPYLQQVREKILRGAPGATKADVRQYLALPGVEAAIRANGADPKDLFAAFPD